MHKLFLAIGLMFANVVFGTLYLEPGEYTLQGEFLYLHLSFDDTYFVATSDFATGSSPNGTRLDNNLHLRPGVRLEWAHALCCSGSEFHVRWTHLNAKRNRTVFAGPRLFPTQGLDIFSLFGGEISSKIDTHFNSIDGFYQKKIYCCFPLTLGLRLGVQFARFEIRENINAIAGLEDGGTEAEQDFYLQKMRGLGPELGLAADLFVWRGVCKGDLSLNFLTWGSLMGAILDSQIKVATNDIFFENFKSRNQNLWKIVPSWHARIGLNYETCLRLFCCNGMHFIFELGYEITTYRQAISKIRYVNSDLPGTSFNYYSSIDMQGPYVSIGFLF